MSLIKTYNPTTGRYEMPPNKGIKPIKSIQGALELELAHTRALLSSIANCKSITQVRQLLSTK